MEKIHRTANLWGENEIGEGTKIGAFCDIGGAQIGKNCKIQCHVSIPPHTKIGDWVFVGPGARFANHKYPDMYGESLDPELYSPEGITVEDKVMIGMGAIIACGVTIGEGARIGMGAVVTKSVPAGETWVGNPAKKL